MFRQICLVGCGGIGFPLALALCNAYADMRKLILIDGDKVSRKNLSRQFFGPADVGLFKVDALARRLSFAFGKRFQIESIPKYVGVGVGVNLPESADLYFCCVDLKASISEVLRQSGGAPVIFAGCGLLKSGAAIANAHLLGNNLVKQEFLAKLGRVDDQLPTGSAGCDDTPAGQQQQEQSTLANLAAAVLALDCLSCALCGWQDREVQQRIGGLD